MDLNDVFSMSFDDVVPQSEATQSSASNEIYAPQAKDGKDNNYKSLIRFVPNLNDISKSIVSKWNIWMVDPVTDEKRYVDCPSSVGKKSIIRDVFFDLRNSESAADQKLSENFSRRQVYFSLIQIIKDTVNPENDGKIKVFRFGKKIYEKIKAFGQPDELDGTTGNPFDLLEANEFLLDIRHVAGFNNYDNSAFRSKKVPLIIDGEPVTNDRKIWLPKLKAFAETLPDLSKYEFKDWTPEIHEFVVQVIKNTSMSGKIMDKIFKAHNLSNKTQKSNNVETVEVDSDSDSDFDMEAAPQKSSTKTAKNPTKASTAKKSNVPASPAATEDTNDAEIDIDSLDLDGEDFDLYADI